MRKIKLQMHISLDGFVAKTNNEPVNSNMNDELRDHAIANLKNVDTILLGRKTASSGFIEFWASIAADPKHPDYKVGKLLTDIPKIVFSKSKKKTKSTWANAKMAHGNLTGEIKKLKAEKGKDMLVYGGAGFVSSLIKDQLIDEYHLLFDQVALGSGIPIFKQNVKLNLARATPMKCGIVVLQYRPR